MTWKLGKTPKSTLKKNELFAWWIDSKDVNAEMPAKWDDADKERLLALKNNDIDLADTELGRQMNKRL